MSEKFELLRRVSKDEVASGYQMVEKFAIDKPTILVIGGANDLRKLNKVPSKDSNGYAKAVQMLITGDPTKFPKDVQLFSLVYPKSYWADCKEKDKIKYTGNNDIIIDELQDFSARHLLPLLEGNLGERLPINTLNKRLRNLNIVTHSYGGIIAEQIGNSLRNKMSELGYGDEEINSAMSQVSLLTMGNVANIANTKNNFSKFHILNEGDYLVEDNLRFADQLLGDARTGITSIDKKTRQVIALQEQETLLEIIDKKAYLLDTYAIEHDLSSHLNFSYDEQEGIAQASLAARFLTRAINNSVTNYKRDAAEDGFIELPNVRGIMSKDTFQTRLLEKQFNNVIEKSWSR